MNKQLCPSKHTRPYDVHRNNELIATIFYKIYGGEVEGYYTFCDFLKDWKWIPVNQLNEIQISKLQSTIQDHLNYLKSYGEK